MYLTGLSRGGRGSWYMAYRDASRFAAIRVACGQVGPLPPTKADGTPWLENSPVVPDGDPFVALEERGAPVRYTELPGVGHGVWDAAYQSAEVVEWLLTQQRRSRADRSRPDD